MREYTETFRVKTWKLFDYSMLALMAIEVSVVEQVLAAWGATAESLQTSSKEESDWLALLGGCRLLIEEKTKFDDPAVRQARNDAQGAGQVHGTTLPLTHNNRLSGIVRKAAGQLSSTGKDIDHDARILWFTSVEFDGEAKHYQFMATLYGSTRIFELDRPTMKECYFFRNSDFFRYRAHLDGAVAAHLNGDVLTMKLCLNPYSPNWVTLRDSPYAKQFKHGLIDPIAEEAAGEAYIADTDVPRKDEGAVLRYLEQKYGLKRAMNMDMNMASATIRVDR
jgi:hypothetical protein